MTPHEAGQVLAKAAAFDNRQPSAAAALAWSQALDPALTVRDAHQLITEHYSQTRDWIMPADLNHAASDLRRKRVRAELDRGGQFFPPRELAPADEVAWRQAVARAIGAGASRREAEISGWATIGQPIPVIETTTEHHRVPVVGKRIR